MRDLIIKKLTTIIQNSDEYGIPRHFDCDESEHITDVDELDSLSDEDLLEVLISTIGFSG
jgi:hypothetical protein